MQITVKLEEGDSSIMIDVEPDTPLGKVQKLLCRAFREHFPRQKAYLKIDDTDYGEFVQQPFANCSDGAVAVVRFVQTDDPCFYDCFDRNPNHAWLR